MLLELRAAVRSVRHRPILALAVIVTLTLGIGANTAIFSAVDAVLLKPLPYPDADRLVALYERNRGQRQATQLVAPVRLKEWHAENRSFVGLAGSYFENMTDLTGALPERVAAMRVTAGFFNVIGGTAALGRTFTDQEEHFGGPAVIVISDSFWRQRLNADPSAIGRALAIGGASRTIVGVMPPAFRYPSAATEVWVPAQIDGIPTLRQARHARFLTAVGRLKPGVTLAQAEEDLTAVQTRLGEQYPQTDKGWGASVVSLKEEHIGGIRRSLWFLFGAVAFVLLAACANVACLLLADAARREREIAVRFAIGASRATVVRQLLLEGIVLAFGGAVGGLLVATWGTALLRRAASQLPRIDEVQISPLLVGVTLAVGVVTTLLFALVPALHATALSPIAALAQGGRSNTGGRQTLRRILVITQVALAVVLLAGSGLLVRSYAQLQQVPLGFEPANVWTFRMSAQWNEQSVVARQARTIDRLATIPGVEAAALSQQLPAGLDTRPGEFGIVGRDTGERRFASGRSVSAGYFASLHIPVLKGETCNADPSAKPFAEVLVTRSFADRYFPGEDPVGHALTNAGLPPGTSGRITGVVGDVREGGAVTDLRPLIYFCGYNPYWPDPFFLVRAAPDRALTLDTLRAAMLEIEPRRAIYNVQKLDDVLARALTSQRLSAILIALFAATAVLLAAVGLYGVLAQLVSSRRREIGLRMAIGARPAQIVGSIVAQAAAMTGIGMAVGLAGALALAQFMTSLVFGVSTHDPITFVAVPVVLSAIAALTALVPARRAARIDPMRALREE